MSEREIEKKVVGRLEMPRVETPLEQSTLPGKADLLEGLKGDVQKTEAQVFEDLKAKLETSFVAVRGEQAALLQDKKTETVLHDLLESVQETGSAATSRLNHGDVDRYTRESALHAIERLSQDPHLSISELTMLRKIHEELQRMQSEVHDFESVALEERLAKKEEKQSKKTEPKKAAGPVVHLAPEVGVGEDSELLELEEALVLGGTRTARYLGKSNRLDVRAKLHKDQHALKRMLSMFVKSGNKRDGGLISVYKIYGRVLNPQTKESIENVRIIFVGIGEVLSAVDGSYVFENIPQEMPYAIAARKDKFEFKPDVAKGTLSGDLLLDFKVA